MEANYTDTIHGSKRLKHLEDRLSLIVTEVRLVKDRVTDLEAQVRLLLRTHQDVVVETIDNVEYQVLPLDSDAVADFEDDSNNRPFTPSGVKLPKP